MTGCRTHGDLVGPYVLGALEPDELESMREHLAVCPRCAAEERALAGLPRLLDHADEARPAPALSPAVEEAVLDRFVRERASAEIARPPARSRFAVPAAAAAVVATVVALALLVPGGGGAAYARAELRSTAAGAGASGSAELAEVPAGTRVDLLVRDLPEREGAVYELWCVRTDGRWVSGGTFRPRRDGTAAAQLTVGVRPASYHLMVVTYDEAGAERGDEVMRGRLTY